ncbi:MAG: rarD [Alphaproteobacteria bacterium]|nr:rarD [Alphaproteobacteria bacterium]
MNDPVRRTRTGFALGLSAYFVWGVMPLYFKTLSAVAPTEIVAHRILWSILFLTPLVLLGRRLPAIAAAIRTPRLAMILAMTACLIGINWLVYVYAVVRGHVIEASLGYYLNPLVNVLLGVIVLKERLSNVQKAAVLLAAAAVAILALRSGGAIWISLTLAFSFALYGFFRKVAPVEAIEGLAVETIFLMPVALLWILWLQHAGESGFLRDRNTDLLLVFGGALTALPLLLFTAAAKKLPYSTLGFLQYVAPSLQFLLAVLVFGEPLTAARILCFGMIWISLALFIGEGLRLGRAAARARATAV